MGAAPDLRSLLQLLQLTASADAGAGAGASAITLGRKSGAGGSSRVLADDGSASDAAAAAPPPPPLGPMLLQALADMAVHTGPRCFFNFDSGDAFSSAGGRGSGSSSSSSRGKQRMEAPASQPSGIICIPSLGGGSGLAGHPAAASAGAAAPAFPKHGYSFAAWVRLEDGREAGEAVLRHQELQRQQLAQAGGYLHDASVTEALALASDQALYAMLHQHQQQPQQPPLQQQAGASSQQPPQPPQQVGVALAVRQSATAASGKGGGSRDAPASGGPAGRIGLTTQLVAHCWAPKHSEAVLELQQPLIPGTWHHLVLTHSPGAAAVREVHFDMLLRWAIYTCLSQNVSLPPPRNCCRRSPEPPSAAAVPGWSAAGAPTSDIPLPAFSRSRSFLRPTSSPHLVLARICLPACLLQCIARLRYPSLRDPLNCVCLGTGTPMRPLHGQAGAAFFFSEVLAAGGLPDVHCRISPIRSAQSLCYPFNLLPF